MSAPLEMTPVILSILFSEVLASGPEPVTSFRVGVQFLGIDVRDNRNTARDFVTDRNVQYPSIFDPAMRTLITLGRTYPTSVVPTTMVLDRQHRVAAVYLMALLAEDLRPLLDRLATEA
jgi:peroxiredoxin